MKIDENRLQTMRIIQYRDPARHRRAGFKNHQKTYKNLCKINKTRSRLIRIYENR